MNRRELITAVAAHTGLDPKQVGTVLTGFTEVVTAVVAKGEPVAIPGFAKFAKVERPARMARNPATGEAIRVKASKKARITPLKSFKDAVMTPRQAPKLGKGVWPPGAPSPGAGGRNRPRTTGVPPTKSAQGPAKKAAAKKR